MLQYSWDKQVETWVKKSGILGGAGKDPTVISPKLYRRRFWWAGLVGWLAGCGADAGGQGAEASRQRQHVHVPALLQVHCWTLVALLCEAGEERPSTQIFHPSLPCVSSATLPTFFPQDCHVILSDRCPRLGAARGAAGPGCSVTPLWLPASLWPHIDPP